jgi:hypothetical protein
MRVHDLRGKVSFTLIGGKPLVSSGSASAPMPNWIQSSLHHAVLALTEAGKTELAANLGRLLDEPEVGALQLYRWPEIADLADALYDCDSLEELHRLLARGCELFAVSHCAVLRVRERSLRPTMARMVTTYPEGWVADYVARRFFTVDPVVARALEGPGLYFWDELDCSDPFTTHFLAASAEAGVGPAGITFVADDAAGDTIAVSLSVPLSHASFRQLFAAKQADFADFARLLIDVFGDLAGEPGPGKPVLSEDQLRVLAALATGRSAEEVQSISFAYGSFRTIETAILRTLNARTLTQAVAVAARHSMLEVLPFGEGDVFRPGCPRVAA